MNCKAPPWKIWSGEVNLLKKLTNAALALRRREFQAARIEIARGRLELAREKQLSKSASSGSSAALASTESTAAPRNKAPKSNASRNGAPSGAVASHDAGVHPASAAGSQPLVSLDENEHHRDLRGEGFSGSKLWGQP